MSTTRLKILCVDDEPKVLEGLELHLSRAFDVETATRGADALDVLEAAGPFAVAISDMRMPGMDGVTLLRAIRERSPQTVRILLTGQSAHDDAAGALDDNLVFRVLTKPCAPHVLLATVEAAVARYTER